MTGTPVNCHQPNFSNPTAGNCNFEFGVNAEAHCKVQRLPLFAGTALGKAVKRYQTTGGVPGMSAYLKQLSTRLGFLLAPTSSIYRLPPPNFLKAGLACVWLFSDTRLLQIFSANFQLCYTKMDRGKNLLVPPM